MKRRLEDLLGFPICQRDLWILTGLALVLRLGYLWLGLQAQDVAGVSMWANDTRNYLLVADYWLTGDPAGRQMLFLAGPGYGVLLATSQIMFGQTPWPPLILNILLGCAAPAVIYLTAMILIERRSVALLSGLIVCISWTGISVSVSLLTDQPFYTLHALAILMFAIGLKTDQSRWSLAAGLTASLATYLRTMGQVWPAVFAFTALLYVLGLERRGRWRRFGRSLWAPAILLVLIAAWSAANYGRFGVFTFTSNGVRTAWQYLGSRALAMNTDGLDTETARATIITNLRNATEESPQSEVDIYHICRRNVVDLAAKHPTWLARAFLYNVWENIRVSNDHLYVQLPQYRPLWAVLTRQARDGPNRWIFYGSLAGLIMLIVDRKRTAWIVVGPTFVVFTLLTGFSYWQGSRLHFAAEMAWSILLAYALVRMGDWLGPKWSGWKNRRARAAI